MKSTVTSILLLLSITVSAIPSPVKCTFPSLAPMTKCIGGSFKACTKNLHLPIDPQPGPRCHVKRHRLVGCITHCTDSPRIAIPTCATDCEKPTSTTTIPPPTSTQSGQECYDSCFAASSCVSDPPLDACECNNNLIANCSKQCGLPTPLIAPCVEEPAKPSTVPGPGTGNGADCKAKCNQFVACPMAWPMSCYCQLGHRRTCAQCHGMAWDEEKESAACKGDIM